MPSDSAASRGPGSSAATAPSRYDVPAWSKSARLRAGNKPDTDALGSLPLRGSERGGAPFPLHVTGTENVNGIKVLVRDVPASAWLSGGERQDENTWSLKLADLEDLRLVLRGRRAEILRHDDRGSRRYWCAPPRAPPACASSMSRRAGWAAAAPAAPTMESVPSEPPVAMPAAHHPGAATPCNTEQEPSRTAVATGRWRGPAKTRGIRQHASARQTSATGRR